MIGAARTIIALVSDLLIESRIEAAAQLQGLTVKAATPADAGEMIRSVKPSLVIADLALPALDLDALTSVADEEKVPVIGFHPHVDVELRRAAQRAGLEHVYPRSRFLRDIRKLIAERLPT
jgi:DNA-binding response OmpR family regulator